MKKVMLAAMLLAGFTTFAQRGNHHQKKQGFAKDQKNDFGLRLIREATRTNNEVEPD